MPNPVRFGIVGNGWRAQFFHRAAAALPAELQVAGVVARSSATAETVASTWHVPTYPTVDELVSAQRPDFVIVSVPREVAPHVIERCTELGVAVLCETPPAASVDELHALWARVGASGRVQVAEQYLLYPMHTARLRIVESGVIGQPGSVQVSSTHEYHAISMIRGFLRVGFESAVVDAKNFVAPLIDPIGQRGWTGDDSLKQATTTIATVDFGGAMGLYDFTDNQWHNPLRSRRIVVRGGLGEISDDDVVRLTAPETVQHSRISRRQTGYDLDLDGYDTEHISFDGAVLWRNPYQGLRFSDEEIAIATLLVRTAHWSVGDGEPPYPLADGCEDQAISLAIRESLTTGRPARTERGPWAPAVV